MQDVTPKRVLCVRLDTLGDVVMTTPALRALKALRPAPELTLLTSHDGAALEPLLPDVDHVIAYAAPWMKASGAVSPEADQRLFAMLARRNFDLAVIFTVY